jgi:hypothetical protein
MKLEIYNCTTKSIVYPYYFDTMSIVNGRIQLLWIIKVHVISNNGQYNFHSFYEFSKLFPVIVKSDTELSPNFNCLEIKRLPL